MSGSTMSEPRASGAPEEPPPSRGFLSDLLERAAWTAGQVFFSVLLVTESTGVVDLPWVTAGATALGAAVVSVLTTLVLHIDSLRGRVAENFLVDLLLRLAKTFVSAFLGVVGAATFNVLEFDWASALNLAALATLAALGKGFLARSPDDDDNPSTLLPRTYAEAYPNRS